LTYTLQITTVKTCDHKSAFSQNRGTKHSTNIWKIWSIHFQLKTELRLAIGYLV